MGGHDKSHISLLKDMFGYAIDLVLIRMQMARVDLLGLKDALLKILLCAVAVMVVFLLGFICLLFGLNAALSPVAKLWVFFGLAALSLVVIVGLVTVVMTALKGQQNCLKSTVDGLQADLAYLRGQKKFDDIHIEELEK